MAQGRQRPQKAYHNTSDRHHRLFRVSALLFLLVSPVLTVSAQYELEALKYSRLYQTGTARFVGMGGAFGALGGDITCISTNPAGLGLYRNSALTISPSLYFSNSTADYQGNSYDDTRFNFNFGNLGMVYSRRVNKTKTSGIQFLNFGVAYNRVNNFNHSYSYQLTDSLNSIGTFMQTNAQGYAPGSLSQFQEMLGFNTYLIDTLGSGSTYISNGPQVGQTKQIFTGNESRGSAGEVALAGSMNIANKFFIGANISVAVLNYKNTYTYKETDAFNVNAVFDNLTYQENLDVSGIGVNLKLGFIYRPLNWLRVGASIHSPTWYSMSEDYFNSMSTRFNFGSYSAESGVGHYEYDLTTPWKLQLSAAFVVFKNAAIGIEYELQDYSAINLRSSGGTFINSNAFIDTAYVVTHNIRIGAEYRIDPFRIRAGYQFQMNPFSDKFDINASVHNISAGFGYYTKKWFSADIAYMVSLTSGKESVYRGFSLPQANVGMVNHSLVITGTVHF